MKKWVCVLLVIILIFSCSISFAADSVPSKVLDVRDSVVRVVVPVEEGTGFGSGFAIGTSNSIEYIITNNHVIDGNMGTILVYYGDYDYTEATIVKAVPERDFCILQLNTPIDGMKPLSLFDGDPYSLTGKRVYAIGFPGSADVLFSSGGSMTEDATVTDGIVSGVKDVNASTTGASATALQVNADINHGNSGGPLVSESGVVLGISTYSANFYEDSSGVNGAISISEVLSTLKSEGIAYQASSNIVYSGIIWVIAAIAVAAFAVLLYFFVLRKRIKKTGSIGKTITLSAYLDKNKGHFQFDSMLRTLTPVIRSLDEMHKRAQLSLAVYPQNIRLSKDTMQAFLIPGKEQNPLSGYSAPEQYRQPQQTGAFTDVYQLGAVIYRMLTGETLPDVMTRMEDDSAAQAKIDALDLTNSQRQSLKLSLALRPEVRLSDVSELVSILHLDQSPEYIAAPTQPAKKEHKPMTKKRKKKIIVFSVAGGVAVALVVCASLFITTYNTAIDFLAKDNYKRALSTIEKLPAVNDDIRNLRDFAEAGVMLESGDFDGARSALEALGDFPDAVKLLPKIDYEQGLYLLGQGEIEQGEEMLSRYKASGISEDEIKNIDFTRGLFYLSIEDYQTALSIFEALGDYNGAGDYAAICALGIIASNDSADALTMYQALLPYADSESVAAALEEILPAVYDQGVDAFNAGDYATARACFEITKYLGEEQAALAIINATSINDLIPYLDYPAAIEKIYNDEYLMTDFLMGYWTDNDYYFSMDNDYTTSYNIPWTDGGGSYWEMQGQTYVSGGAACYDFTIINVDVIDVYSYADGYIYRLYRL